MKIKTNIKKFKAELQFFHNNKLVIVNALLKIALSWISFEQIIDKGNERVWLTFEKCLVHLEQHWRLLSRLVQWWGPAPKHPSGWHAFLRQWPPGVWSPQQCCSPFSAKPKTFEFYWKNKCFHTIHSLVQIQISICLHMQKKYS